MAGKKQDVLKRFWKRVNKNGPIQPHMTTPCWLWMGSLQGKGYGQFWTGEYGTTAHRFSWQMVNGDIPKGHEICHTCDVRICMNPDHLFSGTRADNMKDCINKGRTAKGEKHGRSKLKRPQIEEIKQLSLDGKSQREIAEVFNVTQPNIGCILREETWR